jgi:hypothetical protein
MADDPVGREIAQMRKDHAEDFAQLRRDSAEDFSQLRTSVSEGLAQIRTAMASFVPRELHDVQLDRLRDLVATNARDLDRLASAVEADRKADADRRAQEAEQREADRRAEVERAAANRRVLQGAMWAAGLGILVQILSAAGVIP